MKKMNQAGTYEELLKSYAEQIKNYCIMKSSGSCKGCPFFNAKTYDCKIAICQEAEEGLAVPPSNWKV